MDFKNSVLFLCFPLLAVAAVTSRSYGVVPGSASDTEAAANCIIDGSCTMEAMQSSYSSSGVKQICQAILKSDVCQKVKNKDDLMDCDNPFDRAESSSFEGCTMEDSEETVCAESNKAFIQNCSLGLWEAGIEIKDLAVAAVKAVGSGFDWLIRKVGSPIQSSGEAKETYESVQLYFENEYDRVAKEPSTAVAVRDLVGRNPSSIWGGPLSLDVKEILKDNPERAEEIVVISKMSGNFLGGLWSAAKEAAAQEYKEFSCLNPKGRTKKQCHLFIDIAGAVGGAGLAKITGKKVLKWRAEKKKRKREKTAVPDHFATPEARQKIWDRQKAMTEAHFKHELRTIDRERRLMEREAGNFSEARISEMRIKFADRERAVRESISDTKAAATRLDEGDISLSRVSGTANFAPATINRAMKLVENMTPEKLTAISKAKRVAPDPGNRRGKYYERDKKLRQHFTDEEIKHLRKMGVVTDMPVNPRVYGILKRRISNSEMSALVRAGDLVGHQKRKDFLKEHTDFTEVEINQLLKGDTLDAPPPLAKLYDGDMSQVVNINSQSRRVLYEGPGAVRRTLREDAYTIDRRAHNIYIRDGDTLARVRAATQDSHFDGLTPYQKAEMQRIMLEDADVLRENIRVYMERGVLGPQNPDIIRRLFSTREEMRPRSGSRSRSSDRNTDDD